MENAKHPNDQRATSYDLLRSECLSSTFFYAAMMMIKSSLDGIDHVKCLQEWNSCVVRAPREPENFSFAAREKPTNRWDLCKLFYSFVEVLIAQIRRIRAMQYVWACCTVPLRAPQ